MSHSDHVVQFFGRDEQRLAANVARFLADALTSGGAALVIAGESRRVLFERELASLGSVWPADWRARVVWRDDAQTLAEFMRDGRPNRERFEATVGAMAEDLSRRFGRVRAYGEMVGRLWNDRSFGAAIALEQLWNELVNRTGVGLFCGYAIDVLGEDFQMPALRAVLMEHGSVVTGLAPQFRDALVRAMRDALGDERHGMHASINRRFANLPTELPEPEGTILRLRSALPRYADCVLATALAYASE
jgi:hypothetical protein